MAILFGGSGAIFALLLEGTKRSISVKLFFEFGPVIQKEMPFKDISYLQLWWPSCLRERIHFCTLLEGTKRIIKLWQQSCLVDQVHLGNLSKGP